MSIKRIFIVISAIFAASAVFADNSSVTSKKYVDDLMSGYQGKLPGSGANTLMIYDDETGIGEKAIAATLGNSASATSVPTVSAVKTGLDGKQDTITGTEGYVMTGTGNPGEVGEKPIYSSTIRDEYSLVTAESVNSGVINAVNHSLRRVNANGELDNNGTLWEIADTVVAFSYLPAGYTQLEYIESTGTQYIDTGVKLVETTDPFLIDVDVAFADMSGRYLTGFSSASPGYAGRYSNGTFEINNTYTTMTSGIDQRVNFQYGNIKDHNNKLGIRVTKNGETEYKIVTAYSEVPANDHSWVIFANNSTGVSNKLKGKIYHARAYKNDELKFNGIPASHVENNVTVIGMYDTVSGTFFPDAAGGNFIAGPAVAN